MNGRKVLVATICLACLSMLSWADVVYLKDGGVIKGKVIESVPGVSYKIKTADGSIFVFEVDKVERVKFEEVPEVEKRVAPVEEVIPVRPVKVKEKPALSAQKMPISAGGGLGSFKVEGALEGADIGRGMELFGDLRLMVRNNFAIQGELRSGKLSGDEPIEGLPVKSTYKYLSYGATGLLLFNLSPENPLVLYAGGGLSRYNWDYSGEAPETEYTYAFKLSSKESNWGYHLCGGGEYPIGENLFLWGEVRKIIGTIKDPKIKIKVNGNEGEFTNEDWDYGHMVFRGGLRISFK
ncbi:porin family protein [Patescibacteria group bacterium]|nr:porin family protein [Patescibacteria group bacterium]